MSEKHDSAIEQINKMIGLGPIMKELIESARSHRFEGIHYNPYEGFSGAIEFDIKNFSELSAVSSIICAVIPEYRYKHQMSWNGYGEKLIAQWGDYAYPFTIIRLEATVDTWPHELTKGSECKWVKSESVHTKYSLVCAVE